MSPSSRRTRLIDSPNTRTSLNTSTHHRFKIAATRKRFARRSSFDCEISARRVAATIVRYPLGETRVRRFDVETYLVSSKSVGESSGLISPSELPAVLIMGMSVGFLTDGGLCASSFFSMLPKVAANVLATSDSCGVIALVAPVAAPAVVADVAADASWFSPSSSSVESPRPIFRCSASCVCRSISLMSSIVSPFHSSCQAQACMCARNIVFRRAGTDLNTSHTRPTRCVRLKLTLSIM